MGISLQSALICGLVCFWAYQIRAFLSQIARLEAQIDESRLREQKLVDKLLTRHGFAPLLEREEVVKIPDPEVKQPSFIEEAFYQDSILEEVELMNPDLAGRDAAYVRECYPALWMEAQARVDVQKRPLRK